MPSYVPIAMYGLRLFNIVVLQLAVCSITLEFVHMSGVCRYCCFVRITLFTELRICVFDQR